MGGFGVEHIDLFQVVPQVFPLVGAQYSQRQANQGPQMHHWVIAPVMLAEFVDLGMAVVTACYAIVSPCSLDLSVFYLAVFKTLFFESGLQETAAAAATIIVGAVGLHVYEIFFPDNGFHDKSQIFGNGITIAFSDDLAGVLDREFDFKVFVPVGIDL